MRRVRARFRGGREHAQILWRAVDARGERPIEIRTGGQIVVGAKLRFTDARAGERGAELDQIEREPVQQLVHDRAAFPYLAGDREDLGAHGEQL